MNVRVCAGEPRRRAGLGDRGQGTNACRVGDLGKAGAGPGLMPRSGPENGIRWKQQGTLPGACCPVRLLARTVSFGPQGLIWFLQTHYTVQGAPIKPFNYLMFLDTPPYVCLHLLLTFFLAQLQPRWLFYFLITFPITQAGSHIRTFACGSCCLAGSTAEDSPPCDL